MKNAIFLLLQLILNLTIADEGFLIEIEDNDTRIFITVEIYIIISSEIERQNEEKTSLPIVQPPTNKDNYFRGI